jgi:hypothetical protein
MRHNMQRRIAQAQCNQGDRPTKGRKVARLPGTSAPGAKGPRVAKVTTGRHLKRAQDKGPTLLDKFAELVTLTRLDGGVTKNTWHEWRLHDNPEATAESSERDFERLRAKLIEHCVPHLCEPAAKVWPHSTIAETAPTTAVVVMTATDVEKYALPGKRCVRCAKWKPARVPYFHQDKRERDGLRRACVDCRQMSRNGRSLRRHSDSAAVRAASAKYRVTLGGLLATKKARAEQRKHPERAAARNALARAIKSGRIVRPNWCSTCLHSPCKPEAFWPDYFSPLLVSWHCRACLHEVRVAARVRRADPGGE